MKDKSFLILMAMGVGVVMGCKYMMCHPEVRRNMKNMAKSASKRMYDTLDKMD